MTIFGDGEQERAFTHIDDVAPAHRRLESIYRGRGTKYSTSAQMCRLP